MSAFEFSQVAIDPPCSPPLHTHDRLWTAYKISTGICQPSCGRCGRLVQPRPSLRILLTLRLAVDCDCPLRGADAGVPCTGGLGDSAQVGSPASHRAGLELERQGKERRLMSFRARCLQRLLFFVMQRAALRLYCWALLLLYPNISLSVISAFKCREVGDQWLLDVDVSLQCFSSEWGVTMLWAVFGLVLFIMGVPVLFLVVVRRHQNHNVGNILKACAQNPSILRFQVYRALRDGLQNGTFLIPQTQQERLVAVKWSLQMRNLRQKSTFNSLGFLYKEYRPKHWYFEVCVGDGWM